jgi:ubiquinone/menaquinone biosynthesis C-methylase UbiE
LFCHLLAFPDNSVNAILAAGSFHWFANQKAYKEMYRVLEPNGMIGYITNLPSETESPQWIVEAYKILWESYEKTKAPFEHDFKWRDALLASGLFKHLKEDFKLRNFQEMNYDQCIKFFSSFGGVASGQQEDRLNFERKLVGVLNKHFTDNGTVLKGIDHIVEIYTTQSIKTK